MEPKACLNCSKNVWVDEDSNETYKYYCHKCKASAKKLSELITSKRKGQQNLPRV